MASHELAFEEASVLFNIAAVRTQLARQESLGSVEGVKRACSLYLAAAGVFAFVSERYAVALSLPPGADLTQGALAFLVQLMLGQAQECFVMKAAMDAGQVKDGTLAKLAASAAAFYDVARTCAESAALQGLFGSEWLVALGAKSSLLRSTAHYRKACEFLAAGRYGCEIAKLQEAEEALRGGREVAKKVSTGIAAQISALSQLIAKRLEQALKDNTLIYNDPIPARGSWGDCGSAIVVQPTPFPDAAIQKEMDAPFLFDRLAPIAVSQTVLQVCARRDASLAEAIQRLDESSSRINTLFSTLGLPGAVETEEREALEGCSEAGNVPEAIAQKCEEVRGMGGFGSIANSRDTAARLRAECVEMTQRCGALLEEEDREDEGARREYGSRWTRAPSAQLSALLRQQIHAVQKALGESAGVDENLERLYNEHIAHIISLCSSREELEQIIPAPAGKGTTVSTSLLREIRTQIDEGRATLQGRISGLGDEVRAAVGSVDIVSRVYELESAGETDSSAVERIAGEVSGKISDKLGDVEALEAAVGEYERLLARLMAEFGENREGQQRFLAVEEERRVALQNLVQAYEAFKSIASHLQEAVKFYSNLCEKVGQLLQTCSEYVNGRQIECRGLQQYKNVILAI